jgi:hypothetical protein
MEGDVRGEGIDCRARAQRLSGDGGRLIACGIERRRREGIDCRVIFLSRGSVRAGKGD